MEFYMHNQLSQLKLYKHVIYLHDPLFQLDIILLLYFV